MPSEFDELIRELRAIDRIDSLDTEEQGRLIKALRNGVIGARPADRVAVEGAVRLARGGERETDVVFSPPPAAMQKVPSAGELAARTGKLLAELKVEATAVRRAHADISREHRLAQREAVRERTRSNLAKALASFHAGQITGDELVRLEALALRIDAQVAVMERR